MVFIVHCQPTPLLPVLVSLQVMGMADCGQLPAVLSRRSSHGTPTLAVLLSALGVCVASQMQFTAIIEMVNILYCLSELIEFGAFIELRRKKPRRAWAIPVADESVVLFFAPATLFVVAVLLLSSTAGVVLLGAAVSATVGLYVFTAVARERGWVEYNPVQAGWDMDRDPTWVRALVRAARDAAGRLWGPVTAGAGAAISREADIPVGVDWRLSQTSLRRKSRGQAS